MIRGALYLRLLLAVALCAGLALAQTTQGQLNGRISDTSGAVIPGAHIEISNPQTGVKLTTTANEAGQYVMYLPFATYDVRVTAPGFAPSTTTGVLITTASTSTVNVEMQVQAVAEEVTVAAAIAQLETADTTVGAAIEETLLRDVPVPVSGQKRRPYQYISLSPAVNTTNGRAEIAGSRTNNTLALLDGLSTESINTGMGEAAASTEPSVEAIGEYKLLLNNTPAEYGRTSGGLITYATKSGTNEFHGSVWNYHGNSVLNARPWQAASRGNSRSNEFGGAVGGPVILPGVYNGRNKTFFWSTLTYYRQSATGGASALMSLPTAAMREGDFSDPRINTLFDRKDRYIDQEGQVRFRPFTNNMIPLSRRSAVTSKVLALLPLPNRSSDPELNHVGASSSTFKPVDFTTKIDHHFNERHRIAGFYQYGTQPRESEDPLLGTEFGTTNFFRVHRTRFDYSWIASPTVVHQFLFGVNYNPNGTERNNFGQSVGPALGITGTPSDECPWIQLARASPGQVDICSAAPASTAKPWIYNFGYSTLWNKGKHTLKFGYQNQFWKIDRLNLGGSAGGLSVGAAGTYLFGVSGSSLGSETRDTNNAGGFHLADFYLGLPNFVGAAGGLDLREREQYHALYIQDDWKVTPRLTLNLGLRWEVSVPFSEKSGQFTGFDENAENPAIPGVRGALEFFGEGPGRVGTNRVGKIEYNDFGPRLGLAYQITDKLVFRAGGGIQYMAIQDVNVSFINRTGFEAAGVPPPTADPYGVFFEWDNPFPSQVLGQVPNTDAGFRNNQDLLNWMNPNTIGHSPELYFLSAGFQRQFGDWVLETTYFGNLGRHYHDHERINDLAPVYWSLGPLLNLPITHPDVLAAGFAKPYPEFPDDLTLQRALRRFPQYNNISNDAGINTGSNYNAFMFKATKRYSNGLSFLGHWTIAKQLGDTDWAPGAFGSNTRNSYDRKLDKKLERFDTTHRVVLNYSYDLPFGPGKKFGGNNAFSKYVLGGWTIAGIHEYVNGYPISMSGGLSVPIPGGVGQFANRNAGVPLRSSIGCGDLEFGNPAANYIANAGNPEQAARTGRPLAFLPQGDFVQGNAPERDQGLRHCPNYNENFSLLKQVPVNERVSIQLGADCFNCLNRHRFISNRFGQNISAARFGEIEPDQPNGPRVIQLRMRIQW